MRVIVFIACTTVCFSNTTALNGVGVVHLVSNKTSNRTVWQSGNCLSSTGLHKSGVSRQRYRIFYCTMVRNIFEPSLWKLFHVALMAPRISMELLDFFFFLKICAPLRVFENRVVRKIIGSMIDDVTAHWRRLHNEELHDL